MKRLLIFVSVVLALQSCSREPDQEQPQPNDPVVEGWEETVIEGDGELESSIINFCVGGFQMDADGNHRSSTTYEGICTFAVGDLVTIALTRSGEPEDVKLYKVLSDGSLEFVKGGTYPFVWLNKSETVSVRAWSYGTTNETSNTMIAPETYDYSLETDQQSNGYNELLYCKAADRTYGIVTLDFYHQLSRVIFNVKHNREDDLEVTSQSVGNTTSFPTVARFVVPSGASNLGTWNTKSTYNTIIPVSETVQAGFERTYSAVVFPYTYAQNTKFFTITNSDGNYVYSIPTPSGSTLFAGSQYNYTITVKDGHFKTTTTKCTRSDLVVGDVLCSDGCIYSASNASYIYSEGRTAIGIIAYVGTSNSDPVCENRKALVMALKDCGSYSWGPNTVDENDTYFPNKIPLTDYGGYDKTTYAISDGHSHPALTNAVNWKSSADWTDCGSSCTGWFLASGAQWAAVIKSMGNTTISAVNNYNYGGTTPLTRINNYLSVVGSGKYTAFTNTVYWTSSEYDSRFTYFLWFKSSGVGIGATDSNDHKYQVWPVRPFLAF